MQRQLRALAHCSLLLSWSVWGCGGSATREPLGEANGRVSAVAEPGADSSAYQAAPVPLPDPDEGGGAGTVPASSPGEAGELASADAGSAAAVGAPPTPGDAGADGGSSVPEPLPPPDGCDGLALLQRSCGGASCHGQGSPFGSFAASLEDARALVDQPGQLCSGELIFDSASPAESFVLKKLDSPACGAPMPLGAPPLPAEEIACLQSWISTL